MGGIVLKVIIVIMVVVILDYKAGNFISELYKSILVIVIYFILYLDVRLSNGFFIEIYDSFVMLLIPVSIIGTYIVLQKNKIYYFKGIDKNLINENKNEITNIIKNFKINISDDKSDITFLNNRIIFEKVSTPHIDECLSLVGKYLDENRNRYTFADYFIHYAKTLVLPVIIIVSILLILIKIINSLSI